VKKILIIFFIILNLYATDYLYKYDNDGAMVHTWAVLTDGTYVPVDSTDGMCAYWQGKIYITNTAIIYNPIELDKSNYNLTCLLEHSTQICSGYGGSRIYEIHNLSFCENKENCHYSKRKWYCSDKILCPDGQRYNPSTEQCEDIPECPTGSELDNLAIQKCKSLDFVKTETCNPDTGKVNITCKTCDVVLQMLSNYCSAHDGTLKNGSYSCSQNSDGSLNINFSSDFNVSMCEYPNNDNNLTTDNSSGSDYTDNNNSNVDNTNDINNSNSSSDNSDSNNNSDSGSSSSNSDNNSNNENNNNNSNNNTNNNNNSNNSNNTCPNPCYLREHKPVGYQETSYNKNGFLCHKITYPTYENCFLEYHMDGLTCIQGCDNSGSDSNSSGNKVNVKVNIDTSGIEDKLDSINQKLDDFKNLKPDGKFDFNVSLDSNTKSFISQFGDFFNNVGDDLNKIKESFSQVSAMLKSDNYKLNVFNSDVTTCPISADLYGKHIKADICSILLPYRPILSLIFTIVFNFLVIKFFLKLIVYKEDK